MAIYYVETDRGCGLREASSWRSAWAELRRTEGTNHAKGVRKATAEDIANVKAMGGYVPPSAR